MAVEAAAGAGLGFVVNKLLDEVVTDIKLLKKKSENVRKLHGLLDRSHPSVEKLCSSIQHEDPAHKWLIEFHKQLELCRDFINIKASRKVGWKIFKLIRTSKESLQLYESISTLLFEASLQQWASGLSTENDAKILAEMRATHDWLQQQYQRIAELRSTPDIRRGISELQQIEQSTSAIPTKTFRTGGTGVSYSDSGTSDSWPSSATQTLSRDSAFDIPEPNVTFGGEAIAEKLVSYLLSSNCKKWTALHGMEGIGKTCTASKVCHDSRIKEHFSGGIISLTVSKDQPELDNLYRQLFCKIEGPEMLFRLPKESGAAKSYLKGMLDRERVLLVLDDVWQPDMLEHLDVVPENKECVILVTTRDQKVLGRRIRMGKMFEIPRLSPEDSWQLFSYHAFCGCEAIVSPEVEAVAKDVAKECGGLPLALEVIGSTMADKELVPAESALGQSTLRIWTIALERLQNANVGNNAYEALYSKLQLSVDSLEEQDSRLRDCFIYFVAFPEDAEINVNELVRMWIAEGLVRDDVNSSLSAEEEGKILLAFLVAKPMAKLIGRGHATKIHDVLRDVARQNMIRDWDTDSAAKCLYAAGIQISEFPTAWINSATSSFVERLSLRDNDLRQFPESEQFDTPHLQVLILGNNTSLQSLSVTFFQNLSNLRVLDLSDTHIETIPAVLLRKLESLVLLDLTRCTKLQEISDEIESLLNLMFLRFNGCYSLHKLPRVNNLRKLKVYHATVPTRRAKVDVQDLSTEGATVDVQDLSRKDCGQRGIPYTFPPNLRELVLWFSEGEGKATSDSSGPAAAYYLLDVSSLCCLEQLHLYGFVDRYPTGIVNLHHLKVLRIDGDCCKSPLPALERLPALDNDIEFSGYEGAFPSLKELYIRWPHRYGENVHFS